MSQYLLILCKHCRTIGPVVDFGKEKPYGLNDMEGSLESPVPKPAYVAEFCRKHQNCPKESITVLAESDSEKYDSRLKGINA